MPPSPPQLHPIDWSFHTDLLKPLLEKPVTTPDRAGPRAWWEEGTVTATVRHFQLLYLPSHTTWDETRLPAKCTNNLLYTITSSSKNVHGCSAWVCACAWCWGWRERERQISGTRVTDVGSCYMSGRNWTLVHARVSALNWGSISPAFMAPFTAAINSTALFLSLHQRPHCLYSSLK